MNCWTYEKENTLNRTYGFRGMNILVQDSVVKRVKEKKAEKRGRGFGTYWLNDKYFFIVQNKKGIYLLCKF